MSEKLWTVEQMAILRAVQIEHRIWADHNFGSDTDLQNVWLPFAAFAGIVEELGEYERAETRQEQLDAIADATIFLIDMCGRKRLQLADILDNDQPFDKHDSMAVVCGRIAHSMLKSAQGIRGNTDHSSELNAGIKSLVWWLEFEAEMLGENLFEDLLPNVWSTVKRRDWKADPNAENH